MLIAEAEGEKAVERAHRGQVTKESRADAGRGGQPPYGFRIARESYDSEGRGQGRVIFVPNPDEPVEEVIGAVRETRGNVLAATRLLNARGVRARRANWSPKSVAKIVRREEPRLLRQVSPRTTNGELRAPAPLAKLVRCHCGTTMTPRAGSHSTATTGSARRGARALRRPRPPRLRHASRRDSSDQAHHDLEVRWRRHGRTAHDIGAKRRLPRHRALADETISEDEYATRKQTIDTQLATLAEVESDWIGFSEPRLLVDFDGDPTELGEALRQRVRFVQLDEQMLPVSVEWRARPHPRRSGTR